MAYKKKYEEYNILVKYQNGDTENLNYNGVNTSNYLEMRKVYNDIKQEYEGKSVSIEFIGKGRKGNLKVFWNKNMNSNRNDLNATLEKLQEMDTSDILKLVKESLLIVKNRPSYYLNQDSVFDKEINVQNHALETIEENYKLSESKKNILRLESAKKIGHLTVRRRDNKYQHKTAKHFLDGVDVNPVIDMVTDSLKYYENISNREYDILTDEKAEELNIIQKKQYRNEKERIRIMSEFKKKYGNVSYDAKTKTVTAYNKANQGNRIKKAN